MSTRVRPAHHLPRSHVWLRALVLLLALLVPGTHAEMRAMPVAAASMETTIEYDVLDTAAALRPSLSLTVHRPTAPLRPAPASPASRARSSPAPPSPPYTLRALRTVVLRC
ncbi:hypothetical protein OG824_10130 [Streptomyces prunicolor]|uniref:hypothetical protein n=1 Tax=Streptomyces prunicolor TaxID=67348 RepID=UPI00224CEBD6|nr:hypothetical protein [Streptomyces prunicolor]MCX5235567.1 hypothetical protein [Streptomyces prunicolor]